MKTEYRLPSSFFGLPTMLRFFWARRFPLARRLPIALLLLPIAGLSTEVEIHRCTQEDGTVAFQETPCPEPADVDSVDTPDNAEAQVSSDDFFDFVNPYDQPEAQPQPSKPELPETLSRDRADCEKTTRDAIDAIDLEMRQGYSKEEGQDYLTELLALTHQLRACKQL